MNRILLCSIFISVCTSFEAQVSDIEAKDTVKVNGYYEKVRYYVYKKNDYDSARIFLNQGFELSKKIGYKNGIYTGYKQLGAFYNIAYKYDLALEHMRKALEVAKENKNPQQIADANNQLGAILANNNQKKEALACFLSALEIFERQNNHKGMVNSYRNISHIYHQLNMEAKRLEYIRQALREATHIKASDIQGYIATQYSASVAYLEFQLNNSRYKDTGMYLAKTGLDFALKNKINPFVPQFYQLISAQYVSEGKTAACIDYCQKALEYRKYMTEEAKFNCFLNLIKANKKEGNLKTAMQYIDSCRSLPVSSKLQVFRRALKVEEYAMNKMMGESEKALKSLEELKSAQDSMRNIETIKTVAELEKKYKVKLKEEQINKLEKQKEIDRLKINLLSWIIVASCIVLLTILVLIRQKNIKNQLKMMETEQRLNRSRINPHFFFNTLSALQFLAIGGKDKFGMAKYFSRFSVMMRQLLENSYQDLVPLQDEIEFLTNYLELQLLHKPDLYTYKILIPEDLAESVKIPSMILQPFVENAIEHGFKNFESGGEIEIEFQTQNQQLLIRIEDNGLAEKISGEKKHTSRALQITQERLSLLHKRFKKNAKFEVKPKSGQGYLVQVLLPLIEV